MHTSKELVYKVDFIERLRDKVNEIPNLPIRCMTDYLGSGDSFVLYPIPGGKVKQEFYNGMKDQQLNYEFSMKAKDQRAVHNTLWLVQDVLEQVESLASSDGSFEFDSITITNKPYIGELDEKGFYVFVLTVQAELTTY